MNQSKPIAAGTCTLAVFALCLTTGCDGAAPGVPAPGAPPKGPTPSTAAAARVPEAAREIYKVPVGDSPTRGGTRPLVTLIVFSEFQCPFCARVLPTMDTLVERYGEDLQIVWKHLPLPFHDRALPAALAAEVARSEGRFWPMHDRLFAEQQALGAADLPRHAATVGLDGRKFAAALANPALKARVEADMKLGESLGVRGTPTFFVNGRRLVGAQPLDKFVAIIDEERARASESLRRGVARADLYKTLTAAGLESASEPSPAAAPGGGPGCTKGNCPGAQQHRPAADDPSRDETVHKIDLGRAPSRGPADAPITVVVFSDFECPFCKRVEDTIAALEKSYPGKVRVVWKNFPLAFHQAARPAAAAALVAHQSGKFWAMHDQLLANQNALGPAALETYAKAVGLDVEGFRAGLTAADIAAAIDADIKQGAALGVTGTPTLFINGRRVAGAHPLPTLRTIVDQELGKRGG